MTARLYEPHVHGLRLESTAVDCMLSAQTRRAALRTQPLVQACPWAYMGRCTPHAATPCHLQHAAVADGMLSGKPREVRRVTLHLRRRGRRAQPDMCNTTNLTIYLTFTSADHEYVR